MAQSDGVRPLGYRSLITADSGAVATLDGTMSFSGCEALPFNPTLKAQITGENKPGGHPGMYVRLDSPVGDVALKTATVTLPEGVSTDPKNLQAVCSRADFDAVRCRRTRASAASPPPSRSPPTPSPATSSSSAWRASVCLASA